MKKLLLILLIPMIGFGQEKSVWINAGIGISNNVEGSDFDFFSDEAKFISPLLSLNDRTVLDIARKTLSY